MQTDVEVRRNHAESLDLLRAQGHQVDRLDVERGALVQRAIRSSEAISWAAPHVSRTMVAISRSVSSGEAPSSSASAQARMPAIGVRS